MLTRLIGLGDLLTLLSPLPLILDILQQMMRIQGLWRGKISMDGLKQSDGMHNCHGKYVEQIRGEQCTLRHLREEIC